MGPTEVSMVFAKAMNEKFFDADADFTYEYAVDAGRKYDRITCGMVTADDLNKRKHDIVEQRGRSVHAFIDRSTGALIKAATWNAPAKRKDKETGLKVDAILTFLSDEQSIMNVVEKADRFGSYLYVR